MIDLTTTKLETNSTMLDFISTQIEIVPAVLDVISTQKVINSTKLEKSLCEYEKYYTLSDLLIHEILVEFFNFFHF